MSTLSTNGRVRKSLAEQIDRLDQILDGLAGALNEGVAAAVKEAVGEAVRAAVAEILANPDLRQQLGAPAPATTGVAAASYIGRAARAARSLGGRLVGAIAAGGRKVAA